MTIPVPDEHPLTVVLRAVRGRLTAQPEVWAQRVYFELAPPDAARPLVLYSVQDAREVNLSRRQDAAILLLIKAVADDLAGALIGAQRIAALLNDAGDQDANGTTLAASGGWRMTTVTQERHVQYSELVDGNRVYHAGGVYRFIMDSRS